MTGCGPAGSLHIVPLGNRRLPPTGPLVREVRPDAAWWWLDDDGNLRVALRETRASLLGKPYGGEFYASLQLAEPPAGSARTYRVGRETMRHRERLGFVQLRSASFAGLVTVSRPDARRLYVRLRLEARQQAYWVFTGWGSDSNVLWAGEFTAFPGRESGEAVWSRTEEGKLARDANNPVPSEPTPTARP